MLIKNIVIFAVVASLNILACDEPGKVIVADAELSVHPSSKIEVGQTATISVVSRNLPRNSRYQWRTDGVGVCDPQNSDTSETKYNAPDSIGELPEKKVKVTVEIYLNRESLRKSIDLTIIPRSNVVKTPVTIPSPPQTDSGTSTAPGRSEKPAIEITKPGVYDPLGGRLGPEMIEGKVYGIDSKDYLVLLYSYTDRWYIQPLDMGDGRFTPIDDNNSFSNQYNVGSKYAALLCKTPCDNPPTRTSGLPLNTPNVVAWTIVEGVRTNK